MKRFNTYILSLGIICCLFTACQKDDPVIPNEEEVITTLLFELSPNSGGTPLVLSFRDLDGDGGEQPVITTDDLQSNETYTGRIEILNEQTSPAIDITDEIREEALEHQIFYQSTTSDLSINYNDQDGNGQPLALITNVTTGDPGSGSLKITLRHEPEKTASGVANGDVTNAGGETDIEVTFSINVQ